MPDIGVLLVEDDVKFRTAFAARIAEAPDMSLLGAEGTVAAGLQQLERRSPDVLLVDLDLPDRRGTELIRYCAEHLPAVDVMVVTVFGDEKNVIESIEAGATSYLLKDAGPENFVEQIRLLHAGGSPISPPIARQLLSRFRDALPGQQAVLDTSDEDADKSSTPALSQREHSVLTLVTKGFTFPEIAGLLEVSQHTVMTYVKRIYRKLSVTSKTEAVYEARKMGILRDE
ncbi:MAG TPA: response regulator transcription factor [Steroidobacteraceae bacterium]|nr:response regulator transcription factor [Steroidobacteraceae bacterium]HRX89688.1 response regulator transcription factor [Steroidobacteraceae bacterium]